MDFQFYSNHQQFCAICLPINREKFIYLLLITGDVFSKDARSSLNADHFPNRHRLYQAHSSISFMYLHQITALRIPYERKGLVITLPYAHWSRIPLVFPLVFSQGWIVPIDTRKADAPQNDVMLFLEEYLKRFRSTE